MLRALTYSVILLGFLGFLSLQLHYSGSQVERRLEDSCARFFRRPILFRGVEQGIFGPVTLRELAVPAAPVFEAPIALRLTGVRLGHRSGGHDDSGAVRARRAHGVLEFRRLDGGGVRWNVEELLSPALRGGTSAEVAVGGASAAIEVEAASLDLIELGAESQRWTVSARDVVVRGRGSDWLSEFALEPSELWREGSLRLLWRPGEAIELTGAVDGVRSLSNWLPLFSKEHRELWRRCQPQGEVDLDLQTAVVSAGRLRELRAVLLNYNSRWILAEVGAEVAQVRGPIVVTTERILLGDERSGEVLRAEVFGVGVTLHGQYERGAGRFSLEVPEQRVERLDLLEGDRATPATQLLHSLNPRGRTRGTLKLVLPAARPGGTEESARVEGDFRFDALSLQAAAALTAGAGRLTFQSILGDGKGTVEFESIHVPCLGELRGPLRYVRRDDYVEVTFQDLQLGAAGDTGGSISGSFRLESGDEGQTPAPLLERLECSIRGFDLRWTSRLLESTGVAVTMKKSRDAAAATGTLELSEPKVPPGLLEGFPDGLEFVRGEGELRWDAGGIHIVHLLFSGREETLRLRGTIQLGGGMDLVCLVSPADEFSFSSESLDVDDPAAWLAAAGESYRAYRIRGSALAPVARVLSELDPVFVPRKATSADGE